MRRAAATLMVLMLGLPALAATPATPPAAAPQADLLRGPFEALPEADRRALQNALLWTGDFVGVVNGTFGPRTRDALTGFARKTNVTPDSVLDAKSRARLLAAGAAARAAVGFAPLKDKPAGVAVSLPTKLLPRRTAGEGGTHYASLDGAIVVDTLSRPAGPGGLPEVFDRMSAASGTRKVTYKLLRPDFFVVSGEIGERKFYSRFVAGLVDGQATIRGVTLAYPKAEAARLDMVALAVAASFDAFPSATAPASSGQDAAVVATSPSKPPQSSAAFALTGIRVGLDAVLTHLPAQSCTKPTVGAVPINLRKQDRPTGLALFSLPPATGAMLVLASAPAAADASLAVLFARDPDGVDVAPAELQSASATSTGPFSVAAGIQGRAEGAPLVDDQGRLFGLLTEPRRVAPSVAGTRLETDYPVIEAARLRTFLAELGIGSSSEGGGLKSLGAVAALWRPLLVRIVCQVAPTP